MVLALQIMIGAILLPFAAMGVVFTGALGVGVMSAVYKAIFKK